jgi:hypothetical protein
MNNKHILNIVIVAMLLTSIFYPMVASMTEASINLPKTRTTYHITNVWELQNMSDDLSGDYILDNNIDASITSTWNAGAGFEPIGQPTQFTGTFNGYNNSINNLFINRPGAAYATALFA